MRFKFWKTGWLLQADLLCLYIALCWSMKRSWTVAVMAPVALHICSNRPSWQLNTFFTNFSWSPSLRSISSFCPVRYCGQQAVAMDYLLLNVFLILLLWSSPSSSTPLDSAISQLNPCASSCISKFSGFVKCGSADFGCQCAHRNAIIGSGKGRSPQGGCLFKACGFKNLTSELRENVPRSALADCSKVFEAASKIYVTL